MKLSAAEYRLPLHCLLYWRNKLLAQGTCVDPIDELLIRLDRPQRWWHGQVIFALKSLIERNPPDLGDCESVLVLLYEAYNEVNPMEDLQIKADFNQLYELMSGIPLWDIDKIIYPVCTL